jgi:hypothetical protein
MRQTSRNRLGGYIMAYQTISNLANISPVTRINGNTCTFTAELTEASFFPGAVLIITFDSKTLALDTIKLKGKGSRSNRDELLGYAEGLFTEWRSQVDYAHEEALEENTVWDIENNCTCDESVESSYFQEYGCCEFCKHSQTSQEAAHGTLYLVDLQDPSEPEESDLEAAKEFLMNTWEEEADQPFLDLIAACSTIEDLNRMLDGIDYELMNEKQLRSIQWEWLCAEAPVKDMSAAERIRERQKFLNSAFVRVETPCSCDDEEDRYTQLHGICEYCNLVVEPVYKAKGKISLRGPKRIAQKLKEKYRSITATYYAEKYGIVKYEVRDIFMSYKETFSSEEYLAVVNLDNLKEHRVLIR